MDYLSEDEVAAFRDSGQFDEQWYVEEYPDVKLVGIDPAKHYLWLGARLGRKPSRDWLPSRSGRPWKIGSTPQAKRPAGSQKAATNGQPATARAAPRRS